MIKRKNSMIGALVLIITAVVLIRGCPQANGGKLRGQIDVAAYGLKIDFMGIIDKAAGNVNGTWENSTIDKQGTFTGSKK